jgi:hypothetical protein
MCFGSEVISAEIVRLRFLFEAPAFAECKRGEVCPAEALAKADSIAAEQGLRLGKPSQALPWLPRMHEST